MPAPAPSSASNPPTAREWAEAAWAIQAWVRSCYDVIGVCTLCGTPDPAVHVNDCPWPDMRRLLNRSLNERA